MSSEKNHMVFNGTDYNAWKSRIIMKLQSKGLWKKVNVDPEPRSGSYRNAQANAKCIIMNLMTNKVMNKISFNELDVREVFKQLDKIYIKRGIEVQVQLQRKLESIKFNLGDDLEKFIDEFEDICRQLDDAVDDPNQKIGEAMKVKRLLLALPDTLDNIVGPSDPVEFEFALDRLRNKNRFLDLKASKSQTVDVPNNEEEHRPEVLITNRKHFGYKSSPYSSQNRFSKSAMVCFQCGKPGHIARHCQQTEDIRAEKRRIAHAKRRFSKAPNNTRRRINVIGTPNNGGGAVDMNEPIMNDHPFEIEHMDMNNSCSVNDVSISKDGKFIL